MPYFFKLSEKNNDDGTLNMNWVRTFIDVAAYVSYNCEGKIAFYLVKNQRHKITTDSEKRSVIISTKNLEDPIEPHYLTHEHQTQSNVPPMFIKLIGKMNNDDLLLTLHNKDEDTFENDINKIKRGILGKILNISNKDDYIHITCAKNDASIMTRGLWSEETLAKNPQRRTIDKPEPEPSEYLLNEITDLFNDLDELDSSGGTLRRNQKNKNKSRVKKSKSNRRTRRRHN